MKGLTRQPFYRQIVLPIVAAMIALFSTPLRIDVRDWPRRLRRAYGIRLLRLHGYAPIAGGATLVTSRSGLNWRTNPGGLPYINDETDSTGNKFFVDGNAPGAGDTAGHGSHPDSPFATIDYAIGRCTANQGDKIYVCAGHAESTSAITCDIAGVTIIGLGEGNARPAITGNAVADVITITADDVVIENLRFVTPSAAVTADINVAAARARIAKCRFELGANIVDAVTITAAGEMPTFEDNEVLVTANGPDSWLKFEGVVDLVVIRRNIVIGSDGTDAFDDGVFDFNNQACTNVVIKDNVFGDGNAAVTVFANGGNVVGEAIGPNYYAALATNADTVPTIGTGGIAAASFAAGAINAAAIANAAIDAATFAADALQAMQDEAEDALEGEDLDHLMMLDSAAQPYPVNLAADSALAKVIAKGDPATPSSYNCTTDSLEALSDKAGGFSGDGGAAQDDSVKASLDLAHTDLDAIIVDTENLEHLTQVTTVAADMTAEVVDGSIISRLLSKLSDTSSYSPTTDSLEMISDKVGGFSGDGGAAADDSVKALLDLMHTDLDAVLADTGTDGVLLGADSITAAKIGDAAFATEHFAASAAEKTCDGVVVTRATAALPQSTSATLFTVTGLCLLKRIVGYVTVGVGNVANATKLKNNTTGAGATTDLCADLDIDNAAADSRFEITGTLANAMVKIVDIPAPKTQVTEVVVCPGTIQLECDGSDGGGGRVRWSATYVPLESGASIVAA